MTLGEFLMVVPEGWIEVPNATEVLNIGFMSEDSILREIWYEIDNALENSGLIPVGHQTVNGRFIRTGDITNPVRIWIATAPIPPA